jgi:uncharacterized protein (DUF433 family)
MRKKPALKRQRKFMTADYVEQRDGGYWIKGTRISLDSIVHAFKRGAAPETIRRSFPLLTLEEVYGAIAFYLARETEIDDFLQSSISELDAQSDARRQKIRTAKPELYKRLIQARQENKNSRQ